MELRWTTAPSLTGRTEERESQSYMVLASVDGYRLNIRRWGSTDVAGVLSSWKVAHGSWPRTIWMS